MGSQCYSLVLSTPGHHTQPHEQVTSSLCGYPAPWLGSLWPDKADLDVLLVAKART